MPRATSLREKRALLAVVTLFEHVCLLIENLRADSGSVAAVLTVGWAEVS